MYSRKIYATGNSTASNVANITIPSRGRIVGVQWDMSIDTVADSTIFAAEISQASASEIAVNAAQQCVSEVRAIQNLTTSGAAFGMINFFTPVDVPVQQGQILYMHILITGTATYYGGAIIWLV